MGCTRINGDPRAGNWWPCTIEAQSVPRAKNKFASDGGKTLMRSLSILLTTAPVSRTFWNVLNKNCAELETVRVDGNRLLRLC